MRCATDQLEKSMLWINEIGDTDHFISLFEMHAMNHFLEHVYKLYVQKIWWSREYFNKGHKNQNSMQSSRNTAAVYSQNWFVSPAPAVNK